MCPVSDRIMYSIKYLIYFKIIAIQKFGVITFFLKILKVYFFQHACIHLIKSDRKGISNIINFFFSNKCCALTFFVFIIGSRRIVLISTTVFSIYRNDKYFSSSKSAFLKDRVTLEL